MGGGLFGGHFQGNVDRGTASYQYFPDDSPFKVVDGIQRLGEVRKEIYTNVRHHVGEQNPSAMLEMEHEFPGLLSGKFILVDRDLSDDEIFHLEKEYYERKARRFFSLFGGESRLESMVSADYKEHARNFFRSFVDDSFRQMAPHINSVSEYNEYFSDSQNSQERQRWINWIESVVSVWRDEYRTQADYAHIDLVLAETAVGNNIPLTVAQIADANPFCLLGYHPYIPVYKGQLHPEHWRWYSGRWAELMEPTYISAGYRPRWFFGEFGAVGLNGDFDPNEKWPNSLAPLDGWRHSRVFNKDVEGFKRMMTDWATRLNETNAWKEGRVYGATFFTSGGGSLWQHFEIKQPELDEIAKHTAYLRSQVMDEPGTTPTKPPVNGVDMDKQEAWDRTVQMQVEGDNGIRLNPKAAIQARITRDNQGNNLQLQAVTSEVTINGRAYQAAESLTGLVPRRVYVWEVGKPTTFFEDPTNT